MEQENYSIKQGTNLTVCASKGEDMAWTIDKRYTSGWQNN
jgi:hypothetical protein